MSENICENLDVDKKDLNGKVIHVFDKSQCSFDPSKDYDFNETSHDFQVLSRKNLIAQQKEDSKIYGHLNKALPKDEILIVPVGYYFRNGVFMRKWRPADVPADADCSVKHQIVLPKCFWTDALSLAHKNPLFGHLGVTKTYYKLLNHFFWPCMKIDVSKFCRPCHICQIKRFLVRLFNLFQLLKSLSVEFSLYGLGLYQSQSLVMSICSLLCVLLQDIPKPPPTIYVTYIWLPSLTE